jgi:bacteriocin-like protein
MKQLSKKEMKQILGGVYVPPDDSGSCGVVCGDGTTRSVDCGLGTNCYSDSSSYSVWCDSTEYCPCDAPPPNT